MNKIIFHFLLFLGLTFQLSCQENRSKQENRPSQLQAASPTEILSSILILGDSITEGYGVDFEQSYAQILKKQLSEKRPGLEWIIDGIAGATTASALARLNFHIRQEYLKQTQGQKKIHKILVFALGSNDGLRGLSTQEIKKNVQESIELALKNQYKILLCGLRVPPNYGAEYSREFARIFSDLAQKYKLAFLPFLLEAVAGETYLNIEDSIHPNSLGHQKIAKNMQPLIEKLLNEP